MNINDKAPEFTLPDQNGKEVSLNSLRGKYVVLFFYPRADTPGCTIEACEFRDSYKKIQQTGALSWEFLQTSQKIKRNSKKSSASRFRCSATPTKKSAICMV